MAQREKLEVSSKRDSKKKYEDKLDAQRIKRV